ncbi:hypothetical protein ACWGTI_14580 [Mesorhizobium sp. ArgA1]
MLGIDGHERPKADRHLIAVNARDLAGELHMLADHGLRSRIDNRMWEGVGGMVTLMRSGVTRPRTVVLMKRR